MNVISAIILSFHNAVFKYLSPHDVSRTSLW